MFHRVVSRVLFVALAFAHSSGLAEERIPRVAAVVTVYRPNSHADVIVGRLLEGFRLDGEGEFPKLKLVSMYVDQRPRGDLSRALAKEHGFSLHDTVTGALTRGGEELAVDAVLVVAEHGDYEKSPTGQKMYPKRRLLGEIVEVFERSRRAVPVFSDKHLSDNWRDAKWIYDQSRRLGFPMMAGSSLPSAWRRPAADVPRDEVLEEIVAVGYGRMDSYGFHALEMVQCLAERRRGGETGVARVECLVGDAVWDALDEGRVDVQLFRKALSRVSLRRFESFDEIPERVAEPVAFVVHYRDGLQATVLMLNGAVGQFAVAWRNEDGERTGTLFQLEEVRPFSHFTHLVKGFEPMFRGGPPSWPVERTLLTAGILDAAHVSRTKERPVETPYLDVTYRTKWDWSQPPPFGNDTKDAGR